jgi:protein-tyrosine phosphatase
MSSAGNPVRVLFVCLGNICRSPTAEGVFRKRVAASEIAQLVDIDSAGTAGYHEGAPPDPRSIQHARDRGVDISGLRARKVVAADFTRFDYIIAMDENNHRHLTAMCPPRLQHKVSLLMEWGGEEDEYEVPDPYNGGPDDFEQVLDLVETGCDGLFEALSERLRGQSATVNTSGKRD